MQEQRDGPVGDAFGRTTERDRPHETLTCLGSVGFVRRSPCGGAKPSGAHHLMSAMGLDGHDSRTSTAWRAQSAQSPRESPRRRVRPRGEYVVKGGHHVVDMTPLTWAYSCDDGITTDQKVGGSSPPECATLRQWRRSPVLALASRASSCAVPNPGPELWKRFGRLLSCHGWGALVRAATHIQCRCPESARGRSRCRFQAAGTRDRAASIASATSARRSGNNCLVMVARSGRGGAHA